MRRKLCVHDGAADFQVPGVVGICIINAVLFRFVTDGLYPLELTNRWVSELIRKNYSLQFVSACFRLSDVRQPTASFD